jgi:Na+-driven multidrug efflux pump
MDTATFLMLLFAFSIISSLFTEGVKKLMNDKANLSYNLIALCIALIVGSIGTAIYYQLNNIGFNTNNIIYMILLGLSSGLSSMVGYDKVRQTIIQIVNKQN